MRWWPFRRREIRPHNQATEALRQAEGELQKAHDQDTRAEEAVRYAREVVRRTGNFTRDVDRALRLRGVP